MGVRIVSVERLCRMYPGVAKAVAAHTGRQWARWTRGRHGERIYRTVYMGTDNRVLLRSVSKRARVDRLLWQPPQ